VKRKRVDPRNASVIEIAYAGTGSMLKAARVVAFIQAWAVVRRELGREPSIEEYAEGWKESVATAYRHQALFRECFTRCQTPAPVLDLLERARAERADMTELVAVPA
jgi:predicted metal-binding membrane protein